MFENSFLPSARPGAYFTDTPAFIYVLRSIYAELAGQLHRFFIFLKQIGFSFISMKKPFNIFTMLPVSHYGQESSDYVKLRQGPPAPFRKP